MKSGTLGEKEDRYTELPDGNNFIRDPIQHIRCILNNYLKLQHGLWGRLNILNCEIFACNLDIRSKTCNLRRC